MNFRENKNFKLTMQPNKWTLFTRTCIIIQLYRFIIIAFKILKMDLKKH
jgi:hypothetical protein